MSDRLTTWNNLADAARTYAATPTREASQALSRAAIAWAAVEAMNQPDAKAAPRADEFVFRFGKSKGKTPAEVDVRDLRWYERAFRQGIDDPEKERWKPQNEAALEAVRAELRRRGEAADHG